MNFGDERQFTGQAPTHLPHLIHSGETEISSGFKSIGQARVQAIQEMHLSWSHLICTRENLLNQP